MLETRGQVIQKTKLFYLAPVDTDWVAQVVSSSTFSTENIDRELRDLNVTSDESRSVVSTINEWLITNNFKIDTWNTK